MSLLSLAGLATSGQDVPCCTASSDEGFGVSRTKLQFLVAWRRCSQLRDECVRFVFGEFLYRVGDVGGLCSEHFLDILRSPELRGGCSARYEYFGVVQNLDLGITQGKGGVRR